MDALSTSVSIITILSSFVTSIGVFLVARQLRDSRRIAKAQFIHGLEQEFLQYGTIYVKLAPGGQWSTNTRGPQTPEDRFLVAEYLGFFGKIKLLLDDNIIDMKTVDRLFAYRFFVIVNNVHIQRSILYPEGNYFLEVFALHHQWRHYRKMCAEPIVGDSSDLEHFKKDQYFDYIAAYHALQ